VIAMLKKLHLPKAFLRRCQTLVRTTEILALTGNNLVTTIHFLDHAHLRVQRTRLASDP
jgi:hypothetical protein